MLSSLTLVGGAAVNFTFSAALAGGLPRRVKLSGINSLGLGTASDERKTTVLKPLDIVTTAGAQGDIVGALKTLPGAQQIGESEGLFVRGGDGSETKTIIDGMMVNKPFFSSAPDIASRGRFSPFLFKGTIFSTGGYSAGRNSFLFTPAMFGGGKDKAKPVFQKALEMYETFKPASSIAPNWGKNSCSYFIKECDKK